MKVAIVADWIYGGGSERVVHELHKLYPKAPIYTSYCSDEWRNNLDNKVITGYLQKPPFRQLRKFLPLLRQWWFKNLNLSEFDLVISCTGNGEAKFVRVPNGKHISYCYTPVHYYWRHYNEYLENPGFKPAWLARLGLKILVKPLKDRDFKAAQKVDEFISISSHIQKDIKTYYGRSSTLIFPPVDIGRFLDAANFRKKVGSNNYFITIGRQVPLKKTDLIVETFNHLNLPLKVIGRGPENDRLKKIAGPTIILKTDVTDEQMPQELAGAKGFVFASFEDFGIAPIEAMASGTPVIAYKAGGALDYVVPNKTGELFSYQTVESLEKSISKFDNDNYRVSDLTSQAKAFSTENFKVKIQHFIAKNTI